MATLRGAQGLRAAPASVAAARTRTRVVAVAARKTAKTQAQAYVCLDCGWIYDGSQGPFEKLPGSYRCPVCNSPKRRFAKTESMGKKAAATKGAAMRRGAGDGEFEEGDKGFFLAAAAGAAALLAGLYFVLNSQVA